jgi:hypothetical protein
MDRKKEFQEMLDQILVEIIKVEASGNKGDIPVLTRNVINMLRNLNQQIAEQKAQLDHFEKELHEMRRHFKLLLKNQRTKTP